MEKGWELSESGDTIVVLYEQFRYVQEFLEKVRQVEASSVLEKV